MARQYHRNTGIEKWCYKCQKYQPRDMFRKDCSKSDGQSNRCRDCQNIIEKDRKRIRIRIGSADLYRNLFDSQSGCCKICKRHQSEFTQRFAVDHNHENGSIRGLLCTPCNLAIGLLRDNPEIVDSASRYLKS